jgi:hypothetical protein
MTALCVLPGRSQCSASKLAGHCNSQMEGITSLTSLTLADSVPLRAPVNTVDMFMYDFIQVTQGPKRSRAATLFKCLDSVLRPLPPTDSPCRKEPNSEKKLRQGDGAWTIQKVVLGVSWTLSGVPSNCLPTA